MAHLCVTKMYKCSSQTNLAISNLQASTDIRPKKNPVGIELKTSALNPSSLWSERHLHTTGQSRRPDPKQNNSKLDRVLRLSIQVKKGNLIWFDPKDKELNLIRTQHIGYNPLFILYVKCWLYRLDI